MGLLKEIGKLLMGFGTFLGATSIGRGVRTSFWAYPWVQLIHYTGLSIWLGTTLPLDVRLMGFGKRRETAAELSHDLFALNWTGFGILVLGGLLLFSGTANTYLINPAWLIKIFCIIPVALAWHIYVQHKARVWGKTMEPPLFARFAGLIEILLWISVVVAAGLIPNY